jgi:hypothetical protein
MNALSYITKKKDIIDKSLKEIKKKKTHAKTRCKGR